MSPSPLPPPLALDPQPPTLLSSHSPSLAIQEDDTKGYVYVHPPHR